MVGGNLLAAGALSLAFSMVLAVLAKGTATVFGLSRSMTLADFLVVSTWRAGRLSRSRAGDRRHGGRLGPVRLGPRHVTAPLVTTIGDLLTVAGAGGGGRGSRPGQCLDGAGSRPRGRIAGRPRGRLARPDRGGRTDRPQSVPVLGVAIVIDLLAGITIERRLDDLLGAEALLILLPAFLGGAGALGGILCSRLSTQFHLGLDDATPLPSRASGRDIRSVVLLAVPVFATGAAAAHVAAELTGQTGPAFGQILAVALLAGGMANRVRGSGRLLLDHGGLPVRLDPDTYGIPLVTSSLDLVGAFALVLAMVAVGVA